MNADAATVVIFAHLGHWYVGLPVYLGPLVLLAGWLKYHEWRERRALRRPARPTTRETP